MIFRDNEIFQLRSLIRSESDTSIDQSILSSLIPLECLMTNLFLSVDEAIPVSVMIKVYLSDSTINLDEFLPVI